jgi:hypothetical protein
MEHEATSMQLPGEDELSEYVRKSLSKEFEVASDLLRLATGIFQSPLGIRPNEANDIFELWMCLGVVAKACRQYRGILALADISIGDVAQSNGRMLLETMLAAKWLMEPTVTLKRNGVPISEVAGYPLTTALRTKLYIAYDSESTLTMLRGMAKNAGAHAHEAGEIIARAEKTLKEDRDEIGAKWADRQQKGRSYSGVRIEDLADSLGMTFIYDAFYRPACPGVHGADARKYVDICESEDGGLMLSTSSSARGVAEALVLSSLALVEVLQVANQRWGLEIDENLRPLAERVSEMTTQLPEE